MRFAKIVSKSRYNYLVTEIPKDVEIKVFDPSTPIEVIADNLPETARNRFVEQVQKMPIHELEQSFLVMLLIGSHSKEMKKVRVKLPSRDLPRGIYALKSVAYDFDDNGFGWELLVLKPMSISELLAYLAKMGLIHADVYPDEEDLMDVVDLIHLLFIESWATWIKIAIQHSRQYRNVFFSYMTLSIEGKEMRFVLEDDVAMKLADIGVHEGVLSQRSGYSLGVFEFFDIGVILKQCATYTVAVGIRDRDLNIETIMKNEEIAMRYRTSAELV